MSDLNERARAASVRYLERKNYEVLDENYKDYIVAYDNDTDNLVFITVLVRRMYDNDIMDSFAESHRPRRIAEGFALQYLAEHADEISDMAIRFDEMSLVVVGDSRAMLRHHIHMYGSEE